MFRGFVFEENSNAAVYLQHVPAGCFPFASFTAALIDHVVTGYPAASGCPLMSPITSRCCVHLSRITRRTAVVGEGSANDNTENIRCQHLITRIDFVITYNIEGNNTSYTRRVKPASTVAKLCLFSFECPFTVHLWLLTSGCWFVACQVLSRPRGKADPHSVWQPYSVSCKLARHLINRP